MKKIIFIILYFYFIVNVIAQPVITWEKTKHNFGSFKEESEFQTFVFNFTNTGNQALKLTNVKSSCGCVTTSYSTEDIQPGAKGYLSATFDPRNRPNEFIKTITVTTNTEKSTTILTIEGNVIPREKTIIDMYPREFGALRLKKTSLIFSKIFNNQIITDTIEVYNQSQNQIELTFENVSEAVTVKAIPSKLEANSKSQKLEDSKGIIVVSFDASKKNDWGITSDRFNVIINGEKNNQYRIAISATIIENFSHLTADELANAPTITFLENNYDFGTIKQGEKASHNFNFSNQGKSDLVIRKIKTTCGCTATNPEKMVIKSGESSHITVTFNSAGKKDEQHKTITIITNDPKQSETLLKIHGKVEDGSNQ